MKKILLTGGETGGHIYPLLALTEQFKDKVFTPPIKIEYIGPKSKYIKLFKEKDIETHTITGAKIRRYFDFRNFIAIPKFIFSLVEALAKLFFIMPDILVVKGGSGSVALSLAAKFYFIPILVHESDSVPSLTTKITSKLAKKVALSFESTKEKFKEKGTVTGNPIRNEIIEDKLNQNRAKRSFGFNPEEPLILIIGGSQGSRRINKLILNNLDKIVSNFQVFHQVGPESETKIRKIVKSIKEGWEKSKKSKYKFKGSFSARELKRAYNAADVIISRAGAGAISEIAALGKPSVLIPLQESAQNHQEKNAWEYSKNGAAEVLKEPNFTANLLIERVQKILKDETYREEMTQKAKEFGKPDAAKLLSKEIIKILKK